MLLAQINTKHNGRPSEMLQFSPRLASANLDAKRISRELSFTPIRAPGTPGTVRFSEPRTSIKSSESLRHVLPLMSSESMSLRGHPPLHAADVSVSINAQDLQAMTSTPVRTDRELGNIVESELEIDSPFSVNS